MAVKMGNWGEMTSLKWSCGPLLISGVLGPPFDSSVKLESGYGSHKFTPQDFEVATFFLKKRQDKFALQNTVENCVWWG